MKFNPNDTMKIPTRLKTFARRWISQGMRDFFNHASGNSIKFEGKFQSWKQAATAAGRGYAEDALFHRMEQAALAVKSGLASWEQDGVTHDEIPLDFPLLACLGQAALANDGHLVVLDFGGGFGSTYHQCRSYLHGIKSLRWHIVEQDHIAASGAEKFQTRELRFHRSIDSCVAERPNVILLGSVLQYLPEPYELLKYIAFTPTEFLIIDRHPLSMTEELITVQKLPPSLYAASYPCWLFDREKMWLLLAQEYDLLFEWNGKDPPIRGRGIGANYVGGFWCKRPRS